MVERLIRAIQSALWVRWQTRLRSMLSEANSQDESVTIQEAYLNGYRKGYWDAVVDLADSDMIRVPQDSKVSWAALEEVH